MELNTDGQLVEVTKCNIIWAAVIWLSLNLRGNIFELVSQARRFSKLEIKWLVCANHLV